MAIEVRLPQAGMAMTDGEIVAWHKQEGDTVVAGEVLVEVEAAKTTVEVEAPVSGVLTRILVPAGRTVPVFELLALIDDGSEPLEASRSEVPVSALPTPAVERADVSPAARRDRQVTPRARRRAREMGILLDDVEGSGPAGRVVALDVEKAGTARTSSVATVAADVIPLTGMRGTIAQRMHASLQTTAQLTLTSEVDVTELVRLRPIVRQSFNVTYTDFLVRASALALQEHPRLNATIDEHAITLHEAVNVGVAVALEDGLIVPVLHGAGEMNLQEVSQASADLVERARRGALGSADLRGGTFTVTNLGGFSVDAFTPILNPPEVAILGVGRINERLARRTNGIEWRKVVVLSLTIDHRAVDGAPAAAFLQALGRNLTEPDRLLGS